MGLEKGQDDVKEGVLPPPDSPAVATTEPIVGKGVIDEAALDAKAELMKVRLEEAFRKFLKEATEHATAPIPIPIPIPCEKLEVTFRDDHRLESHLSNFEKNSTIGPKFEVSAAIWEKGREDDFPVISVDRTIFFDKKTQEWKVYRSQILIPAKYRGRGMGEKVLGDEEKSYKALGIKEMQLTAGEPIGVYNNAREGFDFADPQVKEHANTGLKSLLLTYNIRNVRKISEVKIKGSAVNQFHNPEWKFSAHELSQMRAFDEQGVEVLFPARRLKDEADTSATSDAIKNDCYAQLPSMPTADIKRALFMFFNARGLFDLKLSGNLEQSCERFFARQVSELKSRPLPASVRQETIEVLQNAAFRTAFLSSLQQLDLNKIMDIEHYPLGKAFFLDMGREDYIPHWYGKKRLD